MDPINPLLREIIMLGERGDYLEERGAFEESLTTEQFQAMEREYFTKVEARIAHCEMQLRQQRTSDLHAALAWLYDQVDVRKSTAHFYKRPTRYHALKAVRLNPQLAIAWVILAEAYEWIALVGGETEEAPDVALAEDYGYKPELEMIKRTSAKPQSYVEKPYAMSVQQQRQIRVWDQAIRCMMKAIQLEPDNAAYQEQLRAYSHSRNEEYKPTVSCE